MEEKITEQKKVEGKKSVAGCLIIIAIIVLIVWAIYPSGEKSIKIDAYSTAQGFVKKYLKSSTSAKFKNFDESFVQKINESTYEINAYVDSQNAFGVMLRSPFSIRMHKSGDDWYCDYFEFDGTKYK